TALCMLWLSQQTIFLWMAIIIALDSLISAGSEPLSTSQALAITDNKKSGFGSIRLWGSLGWVLFTPLSGWLIERTGLVTAFVGYAINMLIAALLLGFILTNPPPKKADAEPHPP